MLNSIFNRVIRITSIGRKINWNKPFIDGEDFTGTGTGFFIKHYYILTAYHVVKDAEKIYININLYGKENIEAKTISIYPENDLALLVIIDKDKIDINKIGFLELGNSDQVELNEKTTVLGYPLSSQKLKITAGVISGRHKNKFQTDTPVNPGNSGGPILNKNNKVIGVVVSKLTSKIVTAVGYAIPINQFKIVENLMYKQKIIYLPWLGSFFQNTDKYLLEYEQKPKKIVEGYYIGHVFKNSCFDKSDIKAGDILCSFDLYKLDKFGDCNVPWNNDKININSILYRYSLFQKIRIIIWSHEKKKYEKKILNLDSYENNILGIKEVYHKPDYLKISNIIFMNLTLNHIINLDPKEKHNFSEWYDYIELKNRINSIITITYIFPESYYKKNDSFVVGDIITKVNNTFIKNIEDLKNILKKNMKYYVFETTNFKKIVIPKELI
jgi:S1-C subfamily serine protease